MMPWYDLKSIRMRVLLGLVIMGSIITAAYGTWGVDLPSLSFRVKASKSIVAGALLLKKNPDTWSQSQLIEIAQSPLFSQEKPSAFERSREHRGRMLSIQEKVEQKQRLRAQQRSQMGAYVVDGIVYDGDRQSLVIFKHRESGNRIYLKEQALLHDWCVFRISKKSVVLRLQEDDSEIVTLELHA